MAAEQGHVSYERVCSGIELVNIYRFISGRNDLGATEITQQALAGMDEHAVGAVDTMVEIYGAEAGNLGLKLMATGGVYFGGGIPPRILTKLEQASFMRAFTDKGRFAALLAAVPVQVIVNDHTALMGAALAARDTLG